MEYTRRAEIRVLVECFIFFNILSNTSSIEKVFDRIRSLDKLNKKVALPHLLYSRALLLCTTLLTESLLELTEGIQAGRVHVIHAPAAPLGYKRRDSTAIFPIT